MKTTMMIGFEMDSLRALVLMRMGMLMTWWPSAAVFELECDFLKGRTDVDWIRITLILWAERCCTDANADTGRRQEIAKVMLSCLFDSSY